MAATPGTCTYDRSCRTASRTTCKSIDYDKITSGTSPTGRRADATGVSSRSRVSASHSPSLMSASGQPEFEESPGTLNTASEVSSGEVLQPEGQQPLEATPLTQALRHSPERLSGHPYARISRRMKKDWSSLGGGYRRKWSTASRSTRRRMSRKLEQEERWSIAVRVRRIRRSWMVPG